MCLHELLGVNKPCVTSEVGGLLLANDYTIQHRTAPRQIFQSLKTSLLQTLTWLTLLYLIKDSQAENNHTVTCP